ncbi:unnamed protein product [Prunus armeniaca]|uniref:Uncharacterized protein n=1 Tax=Prunus armeniaca TaxID=36596 RepID=A0A6J5WD38_PRUAR|nr:unnamed protein product [Prunus armeniaca]
MKRSIVRKGQSLSHRRWESLSALCQKLIDRLEMSDRLHRCFENPSALWKKNDRFLEEGQLIGLKFLVKGFGKGAEAICGDREEEVW